MSRPWSVAVEAQRGCPQPHSLSVCFGLLSVANYITARPGKLGKGARLGVTTCTFSIWEAKAGALTFEGRKVVILVVSMVLAQSCRACLEDTPRVPPPWQSAAAHGASLLGDGEH